ncbi:uncharacterized protein LOC125248878 isoform X2 [Megalobrama amblycephala]|nr:uncharacterized protein LOC125248878 isoform X2 [Megalobrama amblycephala]
MFKLCCHVTRWLTFKNVTWKFVCGDVIPLKCSLVPHFLLLVLCIRSQIQDGSPETDLGVCYAVIPTSYCHLNTAVPILQLTTINTFACLCHPSCPSSLLTNGDIIDPEDEEDHDDGPHNLEARVGEDLQDNLAATVSAPNICVPALHQHDYLFITFVVWWAKPLN